MGEISLKYSDQSIIVKQELKLSKLILSNHNILSQCCSDDYHMTLSGKETKLDQVFNDNIRDIPLSGTCCGSHCTYIELSSS